MRARRGAPQTIEATGTAATTGAEEGAATEAPAALSTDTLATIGSQCLQFLDSIVLDSIVVNSIVYLNK